MTDLPHFSFPFTRNADGTKVEVVEQGTTEHVRCQEHTVVVTPLGYRDARPDFGWPFPEFFTAPIDTSRLAEALRRLVPDSDATIAEWADEISEATRHIEIQELS